MFLRQCNVFHLGKILHKGRCSPTAASHARFFPPKTGRPFNEPRAAVTPGVVFKIFVWNVNGFSLWDFDGISNSMSFEGRLIPLYPTDLQFQSRFGA